MNTRLARSLVKAWYSVDMVYSTIMVARYTTAANRKMPPPSSRARMIRNGVATSAKTMPRPWVTELATSSPRVYSRTLCDVRTPR